MNFFRYRKHVISTKTNDFQREKIMHKKLKKYTGVNARKFFLNLLVLTILFLPGCAMKFPVPDDTNQTILIIPVETRQTLGHFVFTLDVSIKGSPGNEGIKHTVEPNPKMLFSYNSHLKPGKYKITKMVMKAKPGFKMGGGAKRRPEKMKDKVEFELQKGRITILDKMILFQQPDPGKKRVKKDLRNMDENQRAQERRKEKAERKAEQEAMRKQRVRQVQLVNLDESFKAKILEELKEVDNIDQWKM